MDKSPDAFRTISEVADVLETPAHVLRFWESRFPQIKPVKRAGGRRYYRPSDVALLAGIKRLLHDEGLTIRGVQKILRDQGARHVAGLSDDSIDVADLVPGTEDLDEAALLAALEVEEAELGPAPKPTTPLSLTEAAFGAFEDPEEDATAELPADGQADLPLFPTTARAQPVPDPVAAAPVADASRKGPRVMRDSEANLAGLIRAALPGSLARAQPELGLLAQRLANLRARVGDRAIGEAG